MNVIRAAIPDVLILEPKIHGDARGFFFESYNKRVLADIGIMADFVQDNHSRSARHVLRGLHYQIRQPQGKLIRVLAGEIYDVAVDIRKSSSFFGKWIGVRLSAESHRMLWVPEGFAHGFLVLSDMAEVLYKTTDYYAPEYERALAWSDSDIRIDWPTEGVPILSERDKAAARLAEAELFP